MKEKYNCKFLYNTVFIFYPLAYKIVALIRTDRPSELVAMSKNTYALWGHIILPLKYFNTKTTLIGFTPSKCILGLQTLSIALRITELII